MGTHISLMFDGLFIEPESFDENRGHPPTSRRFLREWPRITVTSHDLDHNAECAVCLARFSPDDVAMRLPCGHMYHSVCVKVWLQMSHLCPVCRFELPTDDIRCDAARRAAMWRRRPRVRLEDLAGRTTTELWHLAKYFEVRLKANMMKDELVRAIVTSGRFEVIRDADQLCGAAEEPSIIASGGKEAWREESVQGNVRKDACSRSYRWDDGGDDEDVDGRSCGCGRLVVGGKIRSVAASRSTGGVGDGETVVA
mmetsp:Transcript_69596/g.201709  ORF Transcript_69596/g.201709 Transcript_69596/m.201709 type:complete len:254 (+) Transcript_69596:88-849(+)